MALLDNTDLVQFYISHFERQPMEEELVAIKPYFDKQVALEWNKEELTGEQIEKAEQDINVPLLHMKIQERVKNIKPE